MLLEECGYCGDFQKFRGTDLVGSSGYIINSACSPLHDGLRLFYYSKCLSTPGYRTTPCATPPVVPQTEEDA